MYASAQLTLIGMCVSAGQRPQPVELEDVTGTGGVNRWAGVRAWFVTAHPGLAAVIRALVTRACRAGRHRQPPDGPWILMRLTRARDFSHG
jgi:hypothetical protein